MRAGCGAGPGWLGTFLAACLAALPGGTACPRLCACYVPTEVHCTFRYFTAVPPRIPPDVERINLGYNSLLRLTGTDFSGLEKLELLMLHSNEISTIPDKVFSDLHSLQVLKMSYNKVRTLQRDAFHGLKSLVRLHMDHNRIEFVNPNVFYGLTALRLVHLEGNVLKQLHPDTFVTLCYSQVFKISFMKHIYLSDNVLTSLPEEMLSSLPELESIYLHGNPWSCDCGLRGLAEWATQRPDVMKCKKDRSSGAQQCPGCASPTSRKGRSLADIPSASLTCTKPAIHDALKSKNLTVPGDGDFGSVSAEDVMAPIGSMVLNMTDQAGSRGDLVCNIQKPKGMSPISLGKEGNSTVLRASLSALLVCGIEYEHIQQLWSILALYSNSPLKLERKVQVANVPSRGYKYKQISEKDELFTNIEADLRAEPSWLMQSRVALRLDRTATTLNVLHIQYFTDAQIILPSADGIQERNHWTIIPRDNGTQTEHTALVGGTVELECRAAGEPAPAVEWILADGSRVRAPHISEDGRIVVVETGTLTLRTADTFDTGLYHCIGTNQGDADTLTFRVTVVDPHVEQTAVNGAQLSALAGSTLYLPCTATAVPDAAVSWVMPEHTILHRSVRNRHIFDNGTLRIQGVTGRDHGYFRCVAANRYGVDLLVFQVLVRQDRSTLEKEPVAVGEWEEGDGSGHAMLGSAAAQELAALAALRADLDPAAASSSRWIPQGARERPGPGRVGYRHYRHKTGRRFRGHRRQFVSSARRVDPQRWAAFLEKTKRNVTLIEKRGEVAVKPPAQVSQVPEDEEETSGDLVSPEEEFMMPVTEMATVSTPGTASSTLAQKTPPWVVEAVTPLPSPFSHSTSSDSRWLQTYPEPTVAPGLSQEGVSHPPASGVTQSAVSNRASTASPLVPAGQGSACSGESSEQRLEPVAAARVRSLTEPSGPGTSRTAVDRLNVAEVPTKTGHQIPVVTAGELSPGLGHGYFHGTQGTPTPALASPTIAHHPIRSIQAATAHTPWAQQQQGRRRKISSRRRIVRPGRVPSVKEHRYSFGRPGSARGGPAMAPDVPHSPVLHNVSRSINPFSTEAPLSPLPATTVPLEHPGVGTHQNTTFLREEQNEAGARRTAALTALPRIATGTQGAPRWKQESSAAFQTNTDRAQPVSISPMASHTAHAATEIAISTEVASTLESVTPSMNPRTSPRSSQGGKTTWEHLFGNDAQKEVLKMVPDLRMDTFPSIEISTTLPKTTAALSTSRTSLLLVPLSAGGNHSSSFLPVTKPIHYGNGSSIEHLPTAELRSSSRATTQGTAVPRLKPTVTPIIAPQTDSTVTRRKALRVGRKRGPRRQRPPGTPAWQSVPAGRSTAAMLGGNMAGPGLTTAQPSPAPTEPLSEPASVASVTEMLLLRPTEPLSEPASAASVTEMLLLRPTEPLSEPASTASVTEMLLLRPTAPQHEPAAATQTPTALVSQRSSPPAASPAGCGTAQSPTMPPQTLLWPSQPLEAASAGPAAAPAVPGSEPAQQIKATTTVGDRWHPTTEAGALQEPHVAQPKFPAETHSSTSAAAATAGIAPPSTPHPDPPPAPSPAVPPASTTRTSSATWGRSKSWPKPTAGVTGRGQEAAPRTLPILGLARITTPRAPWWDQDPSVRGWSKRREQQPATASPAALGSLSRSRLAKPGMVGGTLAAFTVLAGSDAFIPCEATGNPRPTIQWIKISSGTDAPAGRGDGRWTVFTNGTLSIARVGLGDRGQYLCTAANPHGAARLLVTLSVVAYPPRIAGGSWQLLTAHSGKPAALRCRAEGRPPPALSWVLANKTHVSHATATNSKAHVEPDGTLVIRDVTVYDRGLYTCVAKNPAGSATLVVRLQVIAAPPAILEEKRQRIEGTMGENLELPCTVEGNPQPSVHWVLFDGTVVKPLQSVNTKLFLFPNGTLHLRSAAPSDSGHYECIATSSTGSERRVVSLVVEHRDTLPKIASSSPEVTRLKFGDKLLLNCTATGQPEPRIIWRLPSKAVVDQWHRMGSRIHVYPNGSLGIEAVTEKDVGDYLCVARNRIGDDLMWMKVSIAMAPAKIDQKQHFKRLVPYGKGFHVDCKASGSPAPEISWSLPDGTMVNNAMLADDSGRRSHRYILFGNGTLYLNKAGVTEGGDYTCYAQNTLGRDEMKVRVTVVVAAPQIKHSYKTHLSVQAGDTALLGCEAAGDPKPRILWLLPSSDVISSSTDRHLLHANGSLSVRQVKLLDAGEYTCVARSPGGEATKLYRLDVVANPPIINGLHGNRTVRRVAAVRHSKKQIDCRAAGTPPPQVMWIMPDNVLLTAPYYGSRVVVHRNGTLEIRNIRPSDTGEFICVARNDGGESVLVVQLEVLEMLRRPTFKNPFNEKVIMRPGKSMTLNCSVDGNPPPDVSWMLPNGTWFANGIRSPQFVTGSDGTLTIYSPDRDKAGKYRCAARNPVGYIERMILLEVGRKPTILTHPPGPVKGVSGEPLSLHCLSEGSPRPSTAWTLPGGRVLDRPHISSRYVLLENGTLVIREATIHDRGHYLCKVHNDAGDASLSVPVDIVAFAPRITSRPPLTVHTVPGAAVQLRCAALGVPTPEITWELPNRSVLAAAHHGPASGSKLLQPPGTLLIRNPRPSDSGTYKCTAKNPLGSDFTVTYVHVM